jgi:hypothetical protein
LLVGVPGQELGEDQIGFAEVGQAGVGFARGFAFAVANQRHGEFEHGLGGSPADAFVFAAEEFAEEEEGLGGSLGEDFASGAAEEFAVGGVVIAGELDQHVFVDFDLPGDAGPGLAGGAEFGGPSEEGMEFGVERVHGRGRSGFERRLVCSSVHIIYQKWINVQVAVEKILGKK